MADRFYTRIEADPSLLRGYRSILDASDLYRAAGDHARALSLDLALHRMFRRVDARARLTARQADQLIRSRLDATQVRPGTPGPHLRDAITSRPLPGTLPGGAVGIADLGRLDGLENPRSGGTYWLVQEIGTGRVDRATGIEIAPQRGRKARGWFMPDRARPSAEQFRVHPYFENAQGKGTPAMVIRREIRGRHYLRDGAATAVAQHIDGLRAISRSAITEMKAVTRI